MPGDTQHGTTSAEAGIAGSIFAVQQIIVIAIERYIALAQSPHDGDLFRNMGCTLHKKIAVLCLVVLITRQ